MTNDGRPINAIDLLPVPIRFYFRHVRGVSIVCSGLGIAITALAIRARFPIGVALFGLVTLFHIVMAVRGRMPGWVLTGWKGRARDMSG